MFFSLNIFGQVSTISYIDLHNFKKMIVLDFPGGTVVKNPPANAGHTSLSPVLGRSCMPRGN